MSSISPTTQLAARAGVLRPLLVGNGKLLRAHENRGGTVGYGAASFVLLAVRMETPVCRGSFEHAGLSHEFSDKEGARFVVQFLPGADLFNPTLG